MKSRKIEFANGAGQRLSARLELPGHKHPVAFVLFAHCFTCNKDFTAVRTISRALSRNGFGVLRFDFTGLGESEGDFSDTSFSSNIEDLIAAGRYLEKEFRSPSMIVGHSLGGAAALFAAGMLDSVKAVATIGTPSSLAHVKHLFREQLDEIDEQGQAEVEIAGRSFNISSGFIRDLSENKLKDNLESLRKPLLLLHSPQDKVVGIDNAAELYTAAMHPKSFISLDGADHLLSDKKDAAYAGDVIARWATRYLELLPEAPLHSEKQVATRTGAEGYTTDIVAGKHTLVADEPEKVGGNDFGPTPYGYLLAALGSCTSMTLRMYADRKKWKLEEATVHLSHEKSYAEDCENCDKGDRKIDRIERTIHLEGELDEKQRERLLQIADRCPVHRTLKGTIEIHSTLGES